MNLNVLIRRIHLGSAFVLLGFVVMYFVTGLVVTHGAWFGEATEQVVRRTEPFPGVLSVAGCRGIHDPTPGTSRPPGQAV